MTITKINASEETTNITLNDILTALRHLPSSRWREVLSFILFLTSQENVETK